MDAEFRSGILLRRGVCTIRARSILNAAAWWGSPAGLARRPYAPSLVYQCIGVAIGAHKMQIRVRGLLFFTCRYRLWNPDPRVHLASSGLAPDHHTPRLVLHGAQGAA